MKAGDVVRHPSLGRGTVIAVRPRAGNTAALVDFGYLVDWVPVEEVGEPADAPEPAGPETAHAEHGQSGDPGNPEPLPGKYVDARRGVLALRLGQVLRSDVRALSAGTERVQVRLEAVVEGALKRQPRALLVEGAWGSGKTHTLTMLDAIATDKGMASSSIILDGDRVCLSDPMGLVNAVVASLRYPGEPAPNGLRRRLPQFRREAERWRPRTPGGHTIANAIRSLPRAAFDNPDALDAFEDYLSLDLAPTVAAGKLQQLGYRYTRLPAIKAWYVAERAARFRELLAGWAEFIGRIGGKGLLAIIDELDVEYARTMGWGQAQRIKRERRAACLKALRGCLASDVPLVVAFGSAPGADVAEEDDPVLDLRKHLGSGGRLVEIQAPQPDLPQMQAIGMKVLDLYERAYPGRMTGVDRNWLARQIENLAKSHMRKASPVPRHFIRKALELFDIAPQIGSERAGPTA